MARDSGEEGMGFLDHLDELRRRLFRSCIALFVAFVACYPFSRPMFVFLSGPVQKFLPAGEKLAYMRLTEPFLVYLKVAALGAIFLASPYILLQFWLFVSPGLYRNEKRYAIPFVISSTGFFLAGAAFAFLVLFPSVCKFFLSMGHDLQMVVTVNEYLSLLFWTVLGVAITFELPVVIGLLARLGLVTPQFLIQNGSVAIVGCMVVAALITPTPDALTMLFVAVPMIGLYGLSIVVAKILMPRASATDDEPGP